VQEIGEDGVEAVLHARSPSAAGRCNACSKDRLETRSQWPINLFDRRSRHSLLKTAPRSTTRDIPGANYGNLIVDNLKMGGHRPNH
jgi:hypothetical protein